eukprot:RCo033119
MCLPSDGRHIVINRLSRISSVISSPSFHYRPRPPFDPLTFSAFSSGLHSISSHTPSFLGAVWCNCGQHSCGWGPQVAVLSSVLSLSLAVPVALSNLRYCETNLI